jgi:hypothetical protein
VELFFSPVCSGEGCRWSTGEHLTLLTVLSWNYLCIVFEIWIQLCVHHGNSICYFYNNVLSKMAKQPVTMIQILFFLMGIFHGKLYMALLCEYLGLWIGPFTRLLNIR